MSIVLFTAFGGVYTVIYSMFLCAVGITTGPVDSPRKRKIRAADRKQNQMIALIIHIGIGVLYMLCRKEEIRDGLLAGLWLEHGQIIYLSFKTKKGGTKT